MIKKYKSSLTAKIFLLTALLLTLCCIATYVFIAWLIPRTYPDAVNLADVTLADMLEEFKHTDYNRYQEIAAGVETNLKALYGESMELHIFDQGGLEIYGSGAPDKAVTDYGTDQRTETYRFSFADTGEEYLCFCLNHSQVVNQVIEMIGKIFPFLIVMVLLISVFAAYLYSRYITYPIIKISRASEKMIDLDFRLGDTLKRTDELGRVYDNLHILAEKLSVTLEELEERNAQLVMDMERKQQAEQQRAELFSSISHELKTPITVVKGQLQGMIRKTGRYIDRDTYLVRSLESLNRLETMVQELLVISKMESPGYTCNRKPFDLASLINQCLVLQEDIFMQKDISLHCAIQDAVVYNGDGQLLKRVFDNLIINALQYSPSGNHIAVVLEKTESTILFTIENTGVHIAEEDLGKLFEAFYRPDQSRNRQTGGNGLGLSVVKRVLDIHGAQYTLANARDGVIFSIHF